MQRSVVNNSLFRILFLVINIMYMKLTSHLISVKDARINVRLTNKTVKVNDILRLTCGVRGNPPPVVTWYKDGREIRGKRKRPRIKHME